MATATNGRASSYLQRAPSPSGLAEVLEVILDKGLVIDAFVRVSVIGIELVTIDARIVIASVDTYLRFAEAVNRLDLTQTKESTTYEDLVKGGSKDVSEGGTKGVIEGIKKELPGHDEEDDEESTKPRGRPSTKPKSNSGKSEDDSEQSEASAGEDEDEGEQDDDGDDDGGGPFQRIARRARYS